jgi:predicted nuclease of predicted toxin-antitoxin system
MSKAAGEEILAFSLEKNAIVVTLDADFHTILAISGASGPSAIRKRLQGLGATEVFEVVQNVLAGYGAALKRGPLVTVKAHKTTCHRLPVGSRVTGRSQGRFSLPIRRPPWEELFPSGA